MTVDDKAGFAVDGPLFLLSKSSNDFVVWEAYRRKLHWVAAANVKRAEVDGAYDLFSSCRAGNANHGEKQ